MRSGDDYKLGIYRKFDVTRTDGKSATGQKHEHCRYFVLDVDHDQYAFAALEAYADKCRDRFPKLAEDIDRLVAGENVFNDWRPGE